MRAARHCWKSASKQPSLIADRAEPTAIAVRLCGWGLILLAVILSLITMFTIEDSIGTAYHMVVMIAIAAYTFYIFVNAIVRTVKAHRRKDRLEVALRNKYDLHMKVERYQSLDAPADEQFIRK